MRDVMKDPPWRGEDLGAPLPDSAYAVSVALPQWDQVVGYEEGDAAVLDRMRTGYPRFFVPRVVRELEGKALSELGSPSGRRCSIYPCARTAERCANYIRDRHDGWEVGVESVFGGGAGAVVYSDEIAQVAADYWRYCGEGISGRQARALLDGEAIDPDDGQEAKSGLRELIARHTGQSAGDVFLYPSGMAAVAAVQRAISRRSPQTRSVQFDFPYVDVLRVQREFGHGVAFFPSGDAAAIGKLAAMIEAGEPPSGVYCEVPSNPLLRSADLAAISAITRPAGVPLIVDDTVATNQNVDVFRYADLATTSLTKYYSGAGDVLAGAVTLNGESPLVGALRTLLADESDDNLWAGDAKVLAGNATGYESRIAAINETAPRLVDWLRQHEAVERVWYPTTETPDCYEAVRRPGGGYSGLFSILLRGASERTPAFYDALRICKGPSLGTNFSIVCPYTMLAHYHELEWCEELGVSRWLIRGSVGLEPFEDLKGRFEQALRVAGG
jgi:cystathionine gamma-synthase